MSDSEVKPIIEPNIKALKEALGNDLDLVLLYFQWLERHMNATEVYMVRYFDVELYRLLGEPFVGKDGGPVSHESVLIPGWKGGHLGCGWSNCCVKNIGRLSGIKSRKRTSPVIRVHKKPLSLVAIVM